MTIATLGRMTTAAAIDVLRAQIAPEASNEELAYFSQVCLRLNLDPFAGQIVLVGRHDKRANRKVHRHQITVDGRRTLAQRTGELTMIDGPMWSGPRDRNGELNWTELWDDDDNPPYVARTLVGRRGWIKPANGTAKWSEFAKIKADGTLEQFWKLMPSHMLGKVSEAMALRRAFPDTITAETVGGFDPTIDPDVVELAEATATNVIEVVSAGERGERPTPAGGEVPASAPPPTADAADQDLARREAAKWSADDRANFLIHHDIEDFRDPWPKEAIDDALGRPF